MKPTLDDINENLHNILVQLQNEYTRAVDQQISLHLQMARQTSRLVAGNLILWRGQERTIIHVSAEYNGKEVQTYYLLDMGGGNYEKVNSITEIF